MGSVFSPYYAWARRRGAADPEQHCAINVALYGDTRRWAMTERDAGALHRDAQTLTVGPSRLEWRGDSLEIRVDEVTTPLPRRLRGRIRIHPIAQTRFSAHLDAAGRHRWIPLAPCARVEVEFEQPALRWSGPGYLDGNAGAAPLEEDFTSWHWSRAHGPDGATTVYYDVQRRAHRPIGLALRFDPRGSVEPVSAPAELRLPRTLWRIDRRVRARDGAVEGLRTLEDTPFYARSMLVEGAAGRTSRVMHESLSLERFRSRWVQSLLPFRMPRRRSRRSV